MYQIYYENRLVGRIDELWMAIQICAKNTKFYYRKEWRKSCQNFKL